MGRKLLPNPFIENLSSYDDKLYSDKRIIRFSCVQLLSPFLHHWRVQHLVLSGQQRESTYRKTLWFMVVIDYRNMYVYVYCFI